MNGPRVLVAGLGNVLLGDDGFGCEVARRLIATQVWPETVRIADFGIRGVHLALELLGEQYDLAIFVDAASRGGPPGTVYVIEPTLTAGDTSAGSPIARSSLRSWRSPACAGRSTSICCRKSQRLPVSGCSSTWDSR